MYTNFEFVFHGKFNYLYLPILIKNEKTKKQKNNNSASYVNFVRKIQLQII